MPSRSHQQRSSRDGTSRRGFASMDPEEQRKIASRGGRAKHRGPRGFAAMDPEEQREIASRGGRASHGGRGRDYYDESRYSRPTRSSSRMRRSSSRYSDYGGDYGSASSSRYRTQSTGNIYYDDYDAEYGRGSSWKRSGRPASRKTRSASGQGSSRRSRRSIGRSMVSSRSTRSGRRTPSSRR